MNIRNCNICLLISLGLTLRNVHAFQHPSSNLLVRQSLSFGAISQSQSKVSFAPSFPALRSTSTDEEKATTAAAAAEDDLDVICARGVCVLPDDEIDEETNEIIPPSKPGLSFAFVWPRALLLVCSVLYGTNFPLGRLMNDALPPSAATSARLLLATIALSPFLLKLKPNLRGTAALCGTFTALGYVSQSIALVDTPAATVSFLGALVVI